jgi:hypothetical protein
MVFSARMLHTVTRIAILTCIHVLELTGYVLLATLVCREAVNVTHHLLTATIAWSSQALWLVDGIHTCWTCTFLVDGTPWSWRMKLQEGLNAGSSNV